MNQSDFTGNPELMASGLSLFVSLIHYFTYLYQAMLVFAPVLTVCYLMLGGIKFSASSGNYHKVQSAKRTITSALIGCVIILIAYPFLNFFSFVLTPSNSPLHFLDWYADIVTMLALVYISWGGIQYITSSGKPSGILEAKKTITYAIEGYILMLSVRLFFYTMVFVAHHRW